MLTHEGLASNVDSSRISRAVHKRLLTWMINKMSRTALELSVVLGRYLLSGHFVISAAGILLVSVGADFVKIVLATDHVRLSNRSDKWQVRRFAIVGVSLGVPLTAEAPTTFLADSSRFVLLPKADSQSLSFPEYFYFFEFFSVLSISERRFFVALAPSLPLATALLAFTIAGALVVIFDKPGFPALGLEPVGAVCVGACALMINDPTKFDFFGHATPPSEGAKPEAPERSA